MKGQIYEPCEICGKEPICAMCMVCEDHCTCNKPEPKPVFKDSAMADLYIKHMEQGKMER